jgi:predicted MFS family arabinose efflux permease
VIGPLAIGVLLNFFDWRTTLLFWAIPGLTIGLLYSLWGAEGKLAVARPRDYRKAVWNDVLKNRTVCALVAVSTLRAMGQTALASFLPLYLVLHLQLPAAVAGAYMSILFLFAGAAPAVVGWVSDHIGHRLLIVLFSLLSTVTVMLIPYLGSGATLAAGLAALGALLWALRPVIVSAAMSAVSPQLSGSIVAFIYGANMGVSFVAPLLAGIVADSYGLPTALTVIAVFPLLAALICVILVRRPEAV